MIDFPFADKREVYAFLRSQLHDSESLEDFDFPVEYMFKGVPDALAEGQDPVAVTLGAMDRFSIEHGLVGIEGDHQQRALREHPDRLLASLSADPNEGIGGGAHGPQGEGRVGSSGGGDLPRRDRPAGADRWGPLIPDLRRLRRARSAGVHLLGRARPAGADAGPARRTPRYGLLGLSRADHRHPARLRTVGGAGGQADDQVAQPALLDVRLRTEALTPGDHRVRQHAGCRQGAVRRVLPDGPVAGAHF